MNPHLHGLTPGARDRWGDLARRLQQRLDRRLATERVRLTGLEQESRALHDELELMEGSAGRRLFLSFRGKAIRTALAFAHPAWTAGSAARRLAARPPLRATTGALTHLRYRSAPLRLAAPASQTSSHPADFQAIRWIGPMTIRHRSEEALLCHPHATITHQLSVPAGSIFVTAVALSPHVWLQHPPPVRFEISVAVTGRPTLTQSVSLDPRRRYTDRRWHPIRIPLPSGDEPATDVTVTLSTSAEGPAAWAWAVFADPRFIWRRPATEVRASLRAAVARLRQSGPRGLVDLVRGLDTTDRERELFALWMARHTPDTVALTDMAELSKRFTVQPLISVVTPVYNTDPGWLRACIESVRRQAYPRWELCLCDDASTRSDTVAVLREYESDPQIKVRYLPQNGGISRATNAALEIASGEFVAMLDHDDELTPDALFRVVEHLNIHPDADMLYSDEDKLDLTGRRCDPYFKPGWSPEHFLTCMYTCHLMVVRRTILDAAGRFRQGYEGAQDYDLVLRLMQVTNRIHHIPRILYHWRKLPGSTASAGMAKPWAQDAGRLAIEDYVRRAGLDADVLPGDATGLFRVRRRVRGRPLVSVVVPTAGRLRTVDGQPADLLAACIRSVIAKTSYDRYEFIIAADEGGVPQSTRNALEGSPHTVLALRLDGPFNFSRKINAAVAAASGEHVVLFNDDLEVIEPEWMTAMLEYSQEREIGAVGAKLLYPDGRLQHVGMVLGVSGIAAHAFHQHPGTSGGYSSSAICVRNYSAVTAACLMSRREVFDAVGGFDERFPIDFNDVDYCLRVRQAGHRIVFTPYARLYHHESASFGPRTQEVAGAEEMRHRWGALIDQDPYYNPNLTRAFPDYRIQP